MNLVGNNSTMEQVADRFCHTVQIMFHLKLRKIMKSYRLFITETGREYLKAPAEAFNSLNEFFETEQELKDFLIERYGKIPKGKRKIYVGPNANPKVIGFTYSFWNQDVSHNSHKWYQTDWIEFWKEEVTKTYFTL